MRRSPSLGQGHSTRPAAGTGGAATDSIVIGKVIVPSATDTFTMLVRPGECRVGDIVAATTPSSDGGAAGYLGDHAPVDTWRQPLVPRQGSSRTLTALVSSSDHAAAERAFKRVLTAAKLPTHFMPHGMRHTYASLVLRQGESIEYVKRQLGHASIEHPVDGRHVREVAPAGEQGGGRSPRRPKW